MIDTSEINKWVAWLRSDQVTPGQIAGVLKDLKITQKAVAEELGLSEFHVSAVIRRERASNPVLELLAVKIMEACNAKTKKGDPLPTFIPDPDTVPLDNRRFKKLLPNLTDQKIILKDEDLRRRTRWAINYAAAEHNLTNITMAEKVGVKVGTLNNYRVMNTSPTAEFIRGFCEKFNFSEMWFLKGEGEPYPGARMRYPEVCDPNPIQSASLVKEESVAFESSLPSGAIGEDVALAIQVLQSKTPYATALHLNIRSFADAVSDKAKIANIEQSYARLEAENARMQIQLANLQAAVEKLQKKNGQTFDDAGEKNDSVAKDVAV
jgi:transcriptional regulator with XRE-family HTH domain